MERILVVDDEIAIRNLLKKFLSLKGYEVHTALNGPTAISKLKEVRPHIVLLDVLMPGIGGIDVLKKIKKIDPLVGIIMVTGVLDRELAKRTIELGAYDYITKPMDFNYLETIVRVKIIDLFG